MKNEKQIELLRALLSDPEVDQKEKPEIRQRLEALENQNHQNKPNHDT